MERGIAEATAALVGAVERGDVPAASGLYTEDAWLLASAAGPIRGRGEIEAYWRAGLDLGLTRLVLESLTFETIPRGVLELGRYAVSVRGEPAEHGSYFALHAQAGDGSWRRAVEVFNPDEPKAARLDIRKEEQ
jgi:ketosteroid isomerase-like protein